MFLHHISHCNSSLPILWTQKNVTIPINQKLIRRIIKEIRKCKIEEVNKLFYKASTEQFQRIVDYTEDPIVSVGIVGNPASCLFDAQLTSVLGNMVKIVAWYDNEIGYSNRLADLIQRVAP